MEGQAGGKAKRGPEWVTMAVLSKPRGNRGELFALPYTNHLERLQPGRQFRLWFPEESGVASQAVTLEDAWDHNGKLIVKFEGFDSIDEAETLRGAALCIREDEREPLPEGEFYYDDLKGCAVVDIASGETLGTVTGFTEGIGPGVLDVQTVREGDGAQRAVEQWQIPFAKEICLDVDVAGRQIRVKLPEGLRELNRA